MTFQLCSFQLDFKGHAVAIMKFPDCTKIKWTDYNVLSLGILLKLSLCKFYYFNHPQVVCPIHYVQAIVLGNQINCFPLLISNSKCTGNQLWNSQAEFKLKKKPIVITIAEHACNHVCSEDGFKAVIVKTVHACLTSKFLVQPSNTECGGLETTCTDSCQMFQHSDRMFEQILQISLRSLLA